MRRPQKRRKISRIPQPRNGWRQIDAEEWFCAGRPEQGKRLNILSQSRPRLDFDLHPELRRLRQSKRKHRRRTKLHRQQGKEADHHRRQRRIRNLRRFHKHPRNGADLQLQEKMTNNNGRMNWLDDMNLTPINYLIMTMPIFHPNSSLDTYFAPTNK